MRDKKYELQNPNDFEKYENGVIGFTCFEAFERYFWYYFKLEKPKNIRDIIKVCRELETLNPENELITSYLDDITVDLFDGVTEEHNYSEIAIMEWDIIENMRKVFKNKKIDINENGIITYKNISDAKEIELTEYYYDMKFEARENNQHFYW